MTNNTLELVYSLARGNSSLQDIRSLLLTCGHEPEAVQEAIGTLIMDENIEFRWTNTSYPVNANIFAVPLDS